jgi:hypothetical protein
MENLYLQVDFDFLTPVTVRRVIFGDVIRVVTFINFILLGSMAV